MNTILRLPTELDTPWLLVDAGALERNLHSMAVGAPGRGLPVRPPR
jgi:D-serine deaminase-like pyridoxal phosphate-dependent protein